MRLCIDAGGTSIRFAFIEDNQKVVIKTKYPISDFPGSDVGFLAALNTFLRQPECHEYKNRTTSLIASVAGPVKNDAAQFTNTDWRISKDQIRTNCESLFPPNVKIHLINDFEALAYGLASLEEEDLVTVFPREGHGDTKIVCGPGTGLGLAALKEKNGQLISIPSEGGHQCFPVETSIDREIREYIMEDWVSYENILSGQGLQLLFGFFCQKTNARYINELSPEEIISLYNSGNVAAKKALEEFSYTLGSFCGNMVLALGATKGVYLWGGILKSFPLEMLRNNMTRRFQQRGRSAGYLSDVPIYKIISDEIALRGCSIYASEALRG
ncbi:MAG: hypothetical protein FHP94_19340 [Denitromonas halophila]|nr:MAG: hypothetical protein FHP94_19340 [Denitromonas halophila]TVT70520.1 MAG: hypothetical protein FHP93_11805 [Denitromonas halophila]